LKVLVTGAAGQLGRALMRAIPAQVQAIDRDRATLDLSDPNAIERCLDAIEPQVLINAAAYTAVDQAEAEAERAHAINARAVGVLARACCRRRIRLVHVSTDFVFDGASSRPYRPDDVTNPLSVYGASKLEGEQQILAEQALDWRIVRTAWVYASTGRNFMLTMLRLFRERRTVGVVADQIGTPTSSGSLAMCVWRVALEEGSSGILHFTDAGVASWYDFAVAIYEEARELGIITNTVDIIPIGTDQYPTPARRPAYSVLEKRATLERLGISPVHWRERLREVLRELRA
jgi:dTDP-4-dehydrorhamnose reductase